MAYDEKLADRIRRAVGPRPDVAEKKMFGGFAFLKDGKMFIGIVKDDLMVRVGPDRYEAALAEAHVRPMDFTGRPMVGYIFVGPGGSRTEKAVKKWVEQGAAFVATLEGSARKTQQAQKKADEPERMTHDRAYWEALWAKTLREHPDTRAPATRAARLCAERRRARCRARRAAPDWSRGDMRP